MMRGTTRYILKQLTIGMLLVTVGLSILLWLSQSLRFIDMIVNKGLSVAVFLKLTMLLLPGFLMVVLPIAIFAITLFTYNKLITDRELVVMRAAGMSQWQLSAPAFILAGTVCILSYGLTMWGAPASVQKFRELQWSIRNDASHLVLKEGEFTEVTDNVVVFVGTREADNVLSGILISDNRNPDRAVTIMAERGALVTGTDVPRLHLINGNRQEYRPNQKDFSILYFDSYTAEFGDKQKNIGRRFRDARERNISELLTAQPNNDSSSPYFLKEEDLPKFRSEGVQRILLPLQVVGMVLLALYGLLGGGFNRRGQSGRIVMTICLMVAFQAASLGINNLANRSMTFLPLLPILTALLIALPSYLLYFRSSNLKSTKSESKLNDA